MVALIILFIIWLVSGRLIGFFASRVTKGEPPYGLRGDLIGGIVDAVAIDMLL